MTVGKYIRTKEIKEKIRKSLLGNIPWNKDKKRPTFSRKWIENMSLSAKGRKKSLEHKLKIGKAHKGNKSYAWKGNDAKYNTIHNWVIKWKEQPCVCEYCGTITAKRYEWANVNHKYHRVLKDYIRLCTSCHREYDKQFKK